MPNLTTGPPSQLFDQGGEFLCSILFLSVIVYGLTVEVINMSASPTISAIHTTQEVEIVAMSQVADQSPFEYRYLL